MQLYINGKLEISFSLFIDTDNPKEAGRQAIEKLNELNVNNKNLVDKIKMLIVHNIDVDYDE